MRRGATKERIAALVAPQLSATEELLGTCTVWAARLTRVPLLFRGRHRHPLALTDGRLLLFDRPRRRARNADPVLALPLGSLTVERARRRVLLHQLILGAGDGRRLVLEFNRHDRDLARAVADGVTSSRQQ
jgi:hypothetical protein